MKTFYVQAEDRENLNNNVLTFQHNYINLDDLSRLSDGCSKGVVKTIETTKLVAITGLTKRDYESEANDWKTAMKKLQDKIDVLKRENEDLKIKMVNQDEFIKIMHDKLTQHESISPYKKK
jgi:hypothetical protein